MPAALIAQVQATPPTAGRAPGAGGAGKGDASSIIVPAALLGAALLLGAVVLFVADRWRRNAARGGSETESLTDFRGMLERGEITEAEYKVLRDRMAAKMKKNLAKPGRPAPDPPPGAPGNRASLGDPEGPAGGSS